MKEENFLNCQTDFDFSSSPWAPRKLAPERSPGTGRPGQHVRSGRWAAPAEEPCTQQAVSTLDWNPHGRECGLRAWGGQAQEQGMVCESLCVRPVLLEPQPGVPTPNTPNQVHHRLASASQMRSVNYTPWRLSEM